MSLSETSLFQVAKRQYLYKFKACSPLLFALAVVQVLTILTAQGGTSSASTGGSGITVSVYSYSSNLVIANTILWAFFAGFICTTQTTKSIDFAYVSNRLSSNISSIGFLLTAGIAGGVLATLSGTLIRVMVFFKLGSKNIAPENFFVPPQDLLLGCLAAILYITLSSSIGYFVGTLIQVSKAFIVLLPLFLVLAMRLSLGTLIDAVTKENSLLLFAIKVLAISVLLVWSSALLSNRLEVRR